MTTSSSLLRRALPLAGLALLAAAQPAAAQFIRHDPGFASTVTPRNDDWHFAPVATGFTMNWAGLTSGTVGINNNGYASLGDWNGGITPCSLSAPCGQRSWHVFNWDLDSRNGNTSPLTYGQGTVDGRAAFAANWFDFGYYSHGEPAMTFQLVLIDRSDIAAGDFDVEYNYGAMNGSWGIAGWSSPDAFFALPDNGTGSASANLSNSRWRFEARNGVIAGGQQVTTVTPEPTTVALMGAGLLAVGAAARRRRRTA